MERRVVLSTFGIALLSGCQEFTESQNVKLGNVEIANRDTVEQSLNVEVHTDEERVLNEEFTLPPRDDNFESIRIDNELPSNAPKFTFVIEKEDEGKINRTYEDRHETGGCHNIIILVTRNNNLDLLEGMEGTCPE